ncbi:MULTISPECIES: HNH endonuclease [Methylotenera]|uniref:HNH endonuclease n=1 Tax=Methylotenera TaxID=359407 RepID=UPI00037BA232|nr:MULTISPECIES: HNH endonuclease signature motif containing protein [Methylotenera]
MDARILALSNAKDCEDFRKIALANGYEELAYEARLRKIQLKTEAYPVSSIVEKECIEAIHAYEEVLLDRNPKSNGARRTWPDIKRLGIIPTVEKAVTKKADPLGYTALVEMRLEKLSFESIILRFPESFSEAAVRQSKLRISSLIEDTKSWTDEELKASVIAYQSMLHDELVGEKYNKKTMYAQLSNNFNRTPKAFEYRMQNISYVLSLMGRSWIKGLKPAKNVGAKIAAKLEAIICDLENIPNANKVSFEYSVQEELRKVDKSPPLGNESPNATFRNVVQISRDHKVKAWVLKRAAGKCECCKCEAPFLTSSGEPFLEVHHLHHLANKGRDTVDNALGLCPNCHRELHYGINSHKLVDELRQLLISFKAS